MRYKVAILLATSSLIAAPLAASPQDETSNAGLLQAGPSIGLTLSPPAVDLLPETTGPESRRPFWARIVVRWADVESERGTYDWSRYEPAVTRIVDSGHEPVLCLTGSNPLYTGEGRLPSPLEGRSLEAWVAFVRAAAREFLGRASAYEIWDGPDRPADGLPAYEPQIYAFVVKSSAIALRAEAEAAHREVAVVQGSIDAGNLTWQEGLWKADVAAYVDVLPVRVVAAQPGAGSGSLAPLYRQAVLHPPAPVLWARIEEGPVANADSSMAAAAAALAGPASAAFLAPPAAPGEAAEVMSWAGGLNAVLSEGYAPAPLGSLTLEDASGRELPGARVLGRFFSEQDFSTLVLCDLGSSGLGAEDSARLIVDLAGLRDARFVDPVEGRRSRTASTASGAGTALRVPFRPYPVAVEFRRPVATPGLELPPEELEVQRERGLTAQEIIARYQEVQKAQDDRLERWTARGRVDFHFRLAQGGPTIDVGIESNYFWERGGELEWEQTDYYINGNRVPWKKIPELPLIQPEKVVTLPLDLTLDKTYVYELAGQDDVGGRRAYVLTFRPAEADSSRSLYRGRVWIDAQSFVRLQVSIVQTNLEAPVLSNEERDTYAPFTGSDGATYWMIGEIAGQQIWTAGGRNFIVQRELRFTSLSINPPPEAFAAQRREAYASNNQMLRDTAKGFRYLEPGPDGTRVVKESVDPSQLFVAGGLFKDNSIDTVVPLAGVNYFNYDLFGKKIQTNIFFAGVFGFFNASKPGLGGSELDAAAEATLSALKRKDKVFEGDQENLVQRVKFRTQDFSARLGVPAGNFFKLTLIGRLDFNSYAQDRDASAEREARNLDFVLPVDHRVLTGTVLVEYNRKGYTVAADGSWSRRSEWRPWGLRDLATGQFVDPEFDPSQKSFMQWRVNAFKEWFLPKFQKIRGEVTYLDGADLDRFSRYQFTFFGGTRLEGFSGTGVRFDRGTILRARYSFNLFDVIQFNAAVQTADVKNELSAAGTQSFTGFGLSGNFVGPWKTVISFSYGRAVLSDIADLEGNQEYLVSVFKLF